MMMAVNATDLVKACTAGRYKSAMKWACLTEDDKLLRHAAICDYILECDPDDAMVIITPYEFEELEFKPADIISVVSVTPFSYSIRIRFNRDTKLKVLTWCNQADNPAP